MLTAGEGKGDVDRHFSVVGASFKRYLRSGHEIHNENDMIRALQVILLALVACDTAIPQPVCLFCKSLAGVSTSVIEIDRKAPATNAPRIKNVSLYHQFSVNEEDQLVGRILSDLGASVTLSNAAVKLKPSAIITLSGLSKSQLAQKVGF